MGFRIFLHSLRLVFTQLGDALRVSGLLYLVATVISFGTFFVFPPTVVEGRLVPSWQWIPATLMVGILYMWIAIGWHRFVLRDETTNALVPGFRGDRILAYFGRGVQVGLLMLVGLLVIMLFIGISGGNPIIMVIGLLVGLSITLLVTYRLAPLFPAAALGEPGGVGQAWAATRGATWDLLLLAIICAVATFVVDLPLEILRGDVLVIAWSTVTGWIKLMVGVSILTAIYGVYVEKRDIA
ncbi:MAG: hypothetical protein P0Y65_12540 [Candidatus Devosia phytovorans]|uniref:Uncharacterized protein n=1 Tax=Candidatus Devosia phytovorans TaxID=3121372 RepID=A0AAJ5VT46_9HYPH|nr:hypothetical protein [Devosia sp.]WEK03033.1 MAG: hypothetical protein P0Y65_12540 [Devosia sp.]